MHFTDIFIRRPVLATVISLLILLLGLRSIQELQVRQYPKTEDTVITVTTAYPGANAELIKGFITTPIQQSIASAEGIDYLTASSTQGLSTIEAHIVLNFDPNKAMTQIMSKVAEVRNTLPVEAEAPVIKQTTGMSIHLMYLSFFSEQMGAEQITDYLTRVVQPKLSTIDGVSQAEILGAKTFAMRIWLDPSRLAALHVTPTDVADALRNNNFLAAVGQTKGQLVAVNIVADTDLKSAKEFRDIVIRRHGETLVRIGDVAKVELGAENYDASVVFNGQQAVFIGISTTPSANPLTVIQSVRDALPAIQAQLPPTLQAKVVYDGSKYISSSIKEVIKTIGEATVIVIVVIYLFLGVLRSVVIPVVTIPLSLIGVTFLMFALGYSLNLLTLLAMVLAIGLVVDDAIVVVENIHRHIEEGQAPLQAALLGAREIAAPVIAMTITLAAVYTPIGFMGGLTGALFKEFALSLAGAVFISGVIALTLSPMMCSRLLLPAAQQRGFGHFLDERFEALKRRYRDLLHGSLNYRPVTAVFIVVVLTSCYFLYATSRSELAPTEDQSVLFMSANAPQDATLNYVETYTRQFNHIFDAIPEKQDYFIVNGMGATNNVIAGLILKPWEERGRTQAQIQPIVQQGLSQVAGLKSVVFPLPSLPGSGSGLPVQFVISSTDSYRSIHRVSEQLADAARKSGLFVFTDTDLKFQSPRIDLNVDRSKAAALGIDMKDIGEALGTMLGGNYVNRFNLEGRSYKVIPQVLQPFRDNAQLINDYRIKTASGALIPLSTVVSIQRSIEPNKLNQFQQLNSATLQGVMRPGLSLGQGLEFLQQQAKRIFPSGYSVNYAGESRQFVQEGHALVYTFFFAVVVIFLVLAAQFESFRDPFIILISVPMSLCGALIFLSLGMASVNIYTQVGLVTLIGLISKHGILIVEFANQLQRKRGLSKRQAVEEAAAIRLRPVLMTTAATVLGVTPLLLASGAGAVSRFDIGLVIATGMMVGTAFTLFVVPAMYMFVARDHAQESAPAIAAEHA